MRLRRSSGWTRFWSTPSSTTTPPKPSGCAKDFAAAEYKTRPDAFPSGLACHSRLLRHALPRTVVYRRGVHRRSVHRRGRHHYRRRRIDRSWGHNDRTRTHDVMHQCGCAKRRPCNAPSIAMVVVMVVVVARRRATPEPTVESARARTGEHHTSRCHSCQHHYQFLVHVFLLFLSLST